MYHKAYIQVLYQYGTVVIVPRKGWKNVPVPEEMWLTIAELIKENPELGCRSVAEFVRNAIRSEIRYRETLEGRRGTEG